MLEASQPCHAGSSRSLQPTHAARELLLSAPTLRMTGVQSLEFSSPDRGMLATGFKVVLPAITADGHLHNFGGAFINGGDGYIAADLLHDVFVGVAVAAQGLNAGFSVLAPCWAGRKASSLTGAVTWGLVWPAQQTPGELSAWMGMAMFAALAFGAPIGIERTLFGGFLVLS